MADNKYISELPKATELKNEAQLIIEQDGQELSLSGEQLKEFVGNVVKDGYTSMAQVTLSPNIVDGKNILTQEMVSESNTIYKIENDFEVVENITMGENSSLLFQGGSIKSSSGAVLTLNKTELSGEIVLGIELSGTIKNLDFESKWFTDKDKFFSSITPTTGYTKLVFEKTDYTLSHRVTLHDGVSVEGNNCKITFTHSSARFYQSSTEFVEVSTITADTSKGNYIIPFADVSQIKLGDILVIRDFTPSSFHTGYADYREGEIIIVSDIVDNNVLISAPQLYGNYTAAQTKVYLKKFNTVTIRDINVTVPDGVIAKVFKLDSLVNSNISNINIDNCAFGIEVYNLFLCNITQCRIETWIDNDLHETQKDSYPIMIGNCQSVNVDNCYLKGGNHGIATGGYYNASLQGFPSRFLRYTNIITRCDGATRGGIDFHPNCEHVYVGHCKTSGILLAGGAATIEHVDCIDTNLHPTEGIIALGNRTTAQTVIKNCSASTIVFSDFSREHYSEGSILISDTKVDVLRFNTPNFPNYTVTLNSVTTGELLARGECTINNCIITKDLLIHADKNVIIQNTLFKDLGRIWFYNPSTIDVIINNCTFISNVSAYIYAVASTSSLMEKLIITNNNFIGEGTQSNGYAVNVSNDIDKLVLNGNIYFPKTDGFKYFVSAPKANHLIGNELFLTSSVAGEQARNLFKSDIVILDSLISNSNSKYFKKYNRISAGESGVIFKDPRVLTLTSTDVGYQAMWVKKPIWWDGTKWIDAMGTEIIIS